MKPMTYEEWIAANPDVEPVICEECGGEGNVECECCGHFGRCSECGGTGEYKNLRTIYREQLKEDRERAERFGLAVEAAP